MSAVHLKPLAIADCNKSSETSSVASCPAIKASTRARFISKPIVVYLVENKRAKGSPT